MRLLLAALALVTLAACDTETADPIVFGGVEVEATGDARLAVEGGRLVVSGLDGNREGGFVVRGTPGRVDVETLPLTVPPGGRFGTRVTDASGLELAALYAEGLTDGRLDFRYAFPDVLGIGTAVLRYKLRGRVVFEGELRLAAGRGSRAQGSAGTGDGEPGSTHVVRDRGKYIVVTDSEGSGARRAGCPGFLVTPPPPLDAEVPDPICTDWVEVDPLVQAPTPTGRVAVTARGVGQFVVRDLNVEGEGGAFD